MCCNYHTLIQDGGPNILSTNLLYTEPRRRHYLPLPTRHPPHRCKRPWSAHARSMGSSSGTKQRSMEWSLVHWPVAVASIGNHCACVVPSIANSPLSPHTLLNFQHALFLLHLLPSLSLRLGVPSPRCLALTWGQLLAGGHFPRLCLHHGGRWWRRSNGQTRLQILTDWSASVLTLFLCCITEPRYPRAVSLLVIPDLEMDKTVLSANLLDIVVIRWNFLGKILLRLLGIVVLNCRSASYSCPQMSVYWHRRQPTGLSTTVSILG